MDEYNTQRKKMALPEYGRNILRMVDHIKTLEDRDERNRAAKAIISFMGNMFPHLRDVPDFKHKLWVHLAIMSDFQLDIDYPYEIPSPEVINAKPAKMPYNNKRIKLKYYGSIMQQMIEKASTFEDGEEKEILTQMLANHMKKSYLIWNKDAVTDDVIVKDLEKLSSSKLTLSDDKKLNEVRDILQRNKKKKSPNVIHQGNNNYSGHKNY